MSSKLDKESMRSAYNDIRADNTANTWAVFCYGEGNNITTKGMGTDYDQFKKLLSDLDRGFGFIRITTGDELSKRSKFAFITWCDPGLSALKRGKLGTDKSLVKNIVQSFAVELLVSEREELDFGNIEEKVRKAGGANYGTGSRD